MCPLRRVDGDRAGPAALGILVPPGRRTFLILRPRSLPWDLLLLRPGMAPAFHDLPQLEATRLAHELSRALLGWDAGGGRIEQEPVSGGEGYWLRVRVGSFSLLTCPRQPGQPYRPLVFTDTDAARTAAAQLAAILCPPPGVEQEMYFNTRHFGSPHTPAER
jgi:hypothetical protein